MKPVTKIILLNCFISLLSIISQIIFIEHLKIEDKTIKIFLTIWGILPVFVNLFLLRKTPKLLYPMNLALIQTTLVVSLGLILNFNSIYLQADPRGPIAIVTFPIIQIIGALFIGLLIKFILNKNSSED
jgi:cytochrome c oxidase subunit IV